MGGASAKLRIVKDGKSSKAAEPNIHIVEV